MTAQCRARIVAVAPNGAYKTTQDHPRLPMDPGMIARTAAECLEAGAAMIHLHVRDGDGGHSLEPDLYRKAMAAIHTELGDRLSVQVTSEAARVYTAPEQIRLMGELAPASMSVGLREFLRSDSAVSEHDMAKFLAERVAQRCLVQYILFDTDDLGLYLALRDSGVIPESPHWLLFVLGRYRPGQVSDPADLLPFLARAEAFDVPWAVCAFGARELDCVAAAGLHGGHARIGFENNLLLRDGTRAPGNRELITQFAGVADELGWSLIDAEGFRNLFDGWG